MKRNATYNRHAQGARCGRRHHARMYLLEGAAKPCKLARAVDGSGTNFCVKCVKREDPGADFV